MNNTYIRFFTNCLIVDGKNRSLIVDLQRKNYFIIPNSLAEIINHFNNKMKLLEVFELYGKENEETITEYLDFLFEKEFCIYVNDYEFDQFLPLDINFDPPALITNVIIEISEVTLSNFEKIIENICKLYCKHIQIVIYSEILPNDLKILLSIV